MKLDNGIAESKKEEHLNDYVAVKALSPKARPFCDRQVVPTEGGLRGSLLHAVPVP